LSKIKKTDHENIEPKEAVGDEVSFFPFNVQGAICGRSSRSNPNQELLHGRGEACPDRRKRRYGPEMVPLFTVGQLTLKFFNETYFGNLLKDQARDRLPGCCYEDSDRSRTIQTKTEVRLRKGSLRRLGNLL
jgi:hypothetical protein